METKFGIKEIIIIILIIGAISIFIAMMNKNRMELNTYVEVLAKAQHVSIIEKIKIENEVLDINIIPSLKEDKDIILYLNLSTYIKNNNIYYDNTILIINKNINLKINDIYFEDLKILSINKNFPSINNEKIIIKVLFSNLDPWITEAVTEGDIIYSQYHKSIIASVIEKKSTPTKVSGITNEGKTYLVDNPTKEDLILDIEIILTDGKKLKIGNDFYFETEKYNIIGKIINYG